jgi:excisionase family DNA binding protein
MAVVGQDRPKLEEFVSVRDVAQALGVHELTLRRLWERGQFPRPIKLGGSLRYRRAAMQQYLERLG